MKLLALIDTETTGLLDDHEARPIEVAVVRWSVEHGCVVDSWSTLLRSDRNPCEAVNGIPVAALALGVEPEVCLYELNRRLLDCDAILAHNAAFDRAMLERIEAGPPGKPWICTKNDVEWSRGRPGCSLVELAVAHHVTVAHAHRALADCMLLAWVLESVWQEGQHTTGGSGAADVEALMKRALRPKVTVEAMVPFDRKDEAKAANFRWEPTKKKWLRTMAKDDVAALPFPAKEIP